MHPRANGVMITSHAFQFQANPVAAATHRVPQEQRTVTDTCDYDVHAAVAIEISECRTAMRGRRPNCVRRKGSIAAIEQQQIRLT